MATYSDSAREHLRYLMMKEALAKVSASKREIRQLKKANIKAGRHPLDRAEAELIVSDHFTEGGNSWIRAVGWLVGQGYAASRHYYKKELPAQIEAEEAAKDEGGGGIDVAAIIAAELGSDPDLSIKITK